MSEEKEKTGERSANASDLAPDDPGTGGSGDNPQVTGTPFRMEIDSLLNPISEDNPSGADLRYEGIYDQIREARREDDASLPQGVWERDLKKAEWETVRNLCLEVLESRSKDLQIAVWLMEALFHLNGFYGIGEGLRIILALSRAFWDTLYPAMEADDFEARISPLIWMNEKLSIQLKFEPITNPKSMDAATYHYADWEQANRLESLAAKDKKVVEEAERKNRVTRAKFLSSVMFTSAAFYKRRYKDLSRSLENLALLEAFLEEQCGPNGPSLLRFRETLSGIHQLIGSFLKNKQEEVAEAAADSDSAGDPGDTAESIYEYGAAEEVKSVALSIRSRAEAYRMLSAAADYLFIHEPHSPTPYLVRRAVSWGNMTLTELLQELIHDERDLKLIFNLLGIRM